MAIISLPSSHLSPLGPFMSRGGALPTPTYQTNMVVAWEFFRGEEVNNFQSITYNGGVSTSCSWKSLCTSPQDQQIYGAMFDVGSLSGTAPAAYLDTTTVDHPFSFAQSGATWPSGTQTVSELDRYNFADFYPSTGTTISGGDPKTFAIIIEPTALPTPSSTEFGFVMGSQTGTDGWRVYITEDGQFNWQYRQYFGFPVSSAIYDDQLDLGAATIGTKYFIVCTVRPDGTNRMWMSTTSAPTAPLFEDNVTKNRWANFPPINVRFNNRDSIGNTSFHGKWYGVWVWDGEFTTAMVQNLYSELQTAGAI